MNSQTRMLEVLCPPWVAQAAERGVEYELSQIRETLSRPYLSNRERHMLRALEQSLADCSAGVTDSPR